jgi:hypothetical protein
MYFDRNNLVSVGRTRRCWPIEDDPRHRHHHHPVEHMDYVLAPSVLASMQIQVWWLRPNFLGLAQDIIDAVGQQRPTTSS